MSNKKKIKIPRILAPLIIALAAALLYSGVVSAPFIFDDLKYIRDNAFIRDLSNFSVLSGTRYLVFLSFALNYAAGGLGTTGYHVVNIALHALNSVLVYLLLRALFRSPAMAAPWNGEGPACSRGEASLSGEISFYISFFTALVFAVHPVETEAVSYISQRFASMAAFFYLSSLTAYAWSRLASVEGRGRAATVFYFLAFAAGLLGQVSKETAFTIPALIILTELLFFSRARLSLRALRPALPFLVLFGVIPVQLFHPFGQGPGGIAGKLRLLQLEELATLSRHDYLVTQFRVLVTYLRLLVFPLGQRGDYDYTIYRSFFAAPVLLSFVFLLVLFAVAASAALRPARRKRPLSLLAAFGVLWFFVTISVESSLVPIKDVIFEHRAYLPSVGIFMTALSLYFGLAGAGRARAGRERPMARALLIPLLAAVVVLGALTYRRNMVWRSDLAFWADAAAKSPSKARAHNNLGNAYYNRGRLKEALGEYEKAIALKKDYYEAYNNLGTALLALGRAGEAIADFRRAIDLRPDYAAAYANAALALVALGRPAEAVRYARSAAALAPAHAEAHLALGMALVDLGDMKRGIGHLREAARLAPGEKNIWKNLGLALRRAGRDAEAEEALQKSR